MNRYQRRAFALEQRRKKQAEESGPGAHCHKLVASVAKEAAGCLYNDLMADNVLFAEWKKQNPGANAKALESRFIAKQWGKCLAFARATLAQLLQSPIEESLKEEILDALILDNSLVRGRGRPDALIPGLHHQMEH